MKKLITSINNPTSDTIHSLCLILTLLCAVQAITHIARLAILVYQFFTIEPTDTISYLDLLSGKPVAPPSFLQLVQQLLLAAIPACLCVLSFRGMSRPVQKGSLIITGVCMIVTSVLLVLMTLPYFVGGALIVVPAEIAAFALAVAAILIMTGKGSNAVILALIVVYAVAATAIGSKPLEALYILSVGFGSFTILMASRDPQMA